MNLMTSMLRWRLRMLSIISQSDVARSWMWACLRSSPHRLVGRPVLTTGIRADWINTFQPAIHSAVDPEGVLHIEDAGADFDRDTALYHAFISLDHPINDNVNLRMGFGHGGRPAGITELFAQDPFITLVQSATSAVIGDEQLNAEQASQFDMALVGQFGAAQLQVSGYWTYINETHHVGHRSWHTT